jgi:hypothetical protein
VKRRAILVVGVLAAGLALARAGATPAPAPGGVKLLEAIESSPRTVVGEIRKPKQLDHRGWVAEFVVETSLVKPDGASDAAFAVAWEEKVAPRPVRFRHGDRVLVSLTPLPDWSLWRQRLPDPEVRARTFAVAHRGDAFLRRPRLGSVSLLEHFVRLSPAERDSDVGVGILARLAEGAELPLAHSAIERLARVPSLDEALDAGPARSLVAALVRPDADDTLTRTWIELAARRRPAALRPPLEAELAAAGDGLAPAALYAALGAITDGLSGETLAFLLEHGPAEHRVAAASRAAGPEAPAALRKLLRRDPEPAVRMAAVKRLAALEGSRALEPAARARGRAGGDGRRGPSEAPARGRGRSRARRSGRRRRPEPAGHSREPRRPARDRTDASRPRNPYPGAHRGGHGSGTRPRVAPAKAEAMARGARSPASPSISSRPTERRCRAGPHTP